MWRPAIAIAAVAGSIALWLVSWHAPQLFPDRVFYSGGRVQLWAGRIIVEYAQLAPEGRDPDTGRPYVAATPVACGTLYCNPRLEGRRAEEQARTVQLAGYTIFTVHGRMAEASWRNGFGFCVRVLDFRPGLVHYTLGVPIWVLPVPFVAWWWWGWRQRRRVRRGQCVRCGYDLRASPKRCPECGASVRLGSVKAATG